MDSTESQRSVSPRVVQQTQLRIIGDKKNVKENETMQAVDILAGGESKVGAKRLQLS